MKDKPNEWVRGPSIHPATTPEELAELEVMLAADPEIRRMRELSKLRETRPFTSEEQTEYDEIMRPITEMAAKMTFDGGENWPKREEVDERV